MKKLKKLAVEVVNMFDQANTAAAIESLGSRGELLKQSIEELRNKLNRKKRITILSSNGKYP